MCVLSNMYILVIIVAHSRNARDIPQQLSALNSERLANGMCHVSERYTMHAGFIVGLLYGNVNIAIADSEASFRFGQMTDWLCIRCNHVFNVYKRIKC